jgi:GTP pyrophosphokinase
VVRAVYPTTRTSGRPRGAAGRRAAKARPRGKATGRRHPDPGLTRVAVRFAPNGGAVPGDRIVGIMTPGEGVTIYPIQSPALADFDNEPDRWLDVRWDVETGDSSQRFPARIALQSMNEPGSLAQITQVIADHDGNIENISMKRRTQDFTDVTIDLSVWDLKHLNAITAELRPNGL